MKTVIVDFGLRLLIMLFVGAVLYYFELVDRSHFTSWKLYLWSIVLLLLAMRVSYLIRSRSK